MPDILEIKQQQDCQPTEEGKEEVIAGPGPETVPGKGCSLLEGTKWVEGIPPPGGTLFCDNIELMTAILENVVDVFSEWVELLNPLNAFQQWLHLQDKGGDISGVTPIIVKIWNAIIDGIFGAAKFAVATVSSIVTTLLDIQSCINTMADRKAARGVWLLKQMVHLIERVRLGVDPGVWATVDIHPHFDRFMAWLDIIEKYYTPIETPSAPEATRAWLLGRISERHRNCVWRLNGLDPDTYGVFAETEREQLDWRDAIQYARRLGQGEDSEDGLLRARGFVTEHDRAMAKEMYWELPGIADHLHWLQRNVFDTDYVRDYRLLEGFDTRFWPVFGQNLIALGMREEYAKLHYAAHWIMPSPEQMQRFLYRSEEMVAAGSPPFTLQDYSRILAEQDYNPLVRQWFTATAYQVPAISYIKEWYRQGVIDRDQLARYHRYLGYNPKDADNFVAIDDLQKRRMRASQSHGWTTAAASTAYVNKQISEDDHNNIYHDLGYTPQEALDARQVAQVTLNNRVMVRARTRVMSSIMASVKNALTTGVINVQEGRDMLVRAGWDKELAFSFASTEGINARTNLTKQAIAYLKRAVLAGVIGFPTAAQELLTLGVDTFAANQYLTVWRMQLTPGRRRRSAGEIVASLTSGHIDKPTAVVMLQNLGYNDIDTMLYMADATDRISSLIAKRKAASDRAGLQRAKAQAALVRQHQKEAKDIIRGMMREIPVAKLMKWAKLGVIGKDFFHKRMVLYGYLNDDIERYYTEACSAKGSACKDTTPGFDGTPGTNGGGGSATK